jgi:hypothetical protein
MANRLSGIKLTDLPPTLRDAVLVTRALGIRYLWVDSLCIIQGDLRDWERESGKMANIYRNSFLTICAVQGQSCLSGFLHRELPKQVNIPFTSTIDCSISGTFSLFSAPTSMYDRVCTDQGWDLPTLLGFPSIPPSSEREREENKFKFEKTTLYDPFKEDVSDSAWASRAWTFQEAVLSPRMLIFGSRMAHMCVGNRCESEDGSSVTHAYWGRSFATKGQVEDKPSFSGFSFVASHRDWYLSMGRYTGRALSYPKDRLPAISALAAVMSSSLGGDYVAGLWVGDLHRGLLWAHFGVTTPEKYLHDTATSDEGEDTADERLEDRYLAPSWSWACQLNLVGWVWGTENLDYTPEYRYLGNEVVASSSDNPFGRVRVGGKLLLDGKICKLPSLEIRRDPAFLGFIFPYVLSSGDEYIAHLLFDWRHSSVLAPKDEATGVEDIARDGPVERVSMILIASRLLNTAEMDDRRSRLEDGNDEAMFGLLLLPTGTDGQYRRVGLFYSETRGLGGRKFWDKLESRRVALV